MTNKHCLDMKLFAAILLLLAVYVSAPAKVTGYALSTGHGHNGMYIHLPITSKTARMQKADPCEFTLDYHMTSLLFSG